MYAGLTRGFAVAQHYYKAKPAYSATELDVLVIKIQYKKKINIQAFKMLSTEQVRMGGSVKVTDSNSIWDL